MKGDNDSRSLETIGAQIPLPVVAIEVLRTRPAENAKFDRAKIVGIMAGTALVQTNSGTFQLAAGDVFVLRANRICTCKPRPVVRKWAIFVREDFLRDHALWSLPEPEFLLPGTHPTQWDGSARLYRPGLAVLSKIDPILRRISVASALDHSEAAAARVVAGYSAAVELMLPAMLAKTNHTGGRSARRHELVNTGPIEGRLTAPAPRTEVVRAARLLRTRVGEAWDTPALAAAVNLSPAHLRRLFNETYGVPPMRFLSEARLTVFARLIEETDLTIAAAARQVGWRDPRVASTWFYRRFRITPSSFRRHPRRRQSTTAERS